MIISILHLPRKLSEVLCIFINYAFISWYAPILLISPFSKIQLQLYNCKSLRFKYETMFHEITGVMWKLFLHLIMFQKFLSNNYSSTNIYLHYFDLSRINLFEKMRWCSAEWIVNEWIFQQVVVHSKKRYSSNIKKCIISVIR